ncbi:MAG: hypothetical protein ACYDA9_12825 [Terriglobia bacterium]
MKELDEDPAAFEQLRESLCRAFDPRDGLEQMLVQDMAEIRWRRQRLMRAEAGILATQKRKFEIEREWKVANYGKGLGGLANDMLSADMGLAGLSLSSENFAHIRETLQALKYSVETWGFKEENSSFLTLVYGQKACYTGKYLSRIFKRGCEESKNQGESGAEEVETTRQAFLEELDKEIASFNTLAELHYARDVELTEPLKDSHLIPSQEDLDKIMRYEVALERQFERKVQQLVAWRRAQGAD